MRKFILLAIVLNVMTSCKINEKPEFVRVDSVDVVDANLKTITLKADAVFLNHNHLGGTLRTDNIDVYVDSHLIAKVSAEEFKVPAKDEFTVPLAVNFDTAKLLDDKKGGLLGSLVFKGNLVYELVGFKSTYAIDHREEIQIK